MATVPASTIRPTSNGSPGRPHTVAAEPPRAPISSLEIYRLEELCQRLGWGRKTLWAAERRGLPFVLVASVFAAPLIMSP